MTIGQWRPGSHSKTQVAGPWYSGLAKFKGAWCHRGWILLICRVWHEMLALHLEADIKFFPRSQANDFPTICSGAWPESEARFCQSPPGCYGSQPACLSVPGRKVVMMKLLPGDARDTSLITLHPLVELYVSSLHLFAADIVSLVVILPPSLACKLNSEGACLLYLPLYPSA